MSLQRTPPTASKSTLVHGQSLSESDLTSASSPLVDKPNITVRSKRQRTEYPSPMSKEEDYVSLIALDSFKADLLDMLTKWKNEHDQRLTTWKISQDAILSRLADDVSDLKKQFLSIETTNCEIERGMNFINGQYEHIVSKVAALEKEKAECAEINSHLQKQIQDLHFQSRQATIEIRNIPPKEKEAPEDLVSLVSSVGLDPAFAGWITNDERFTSTDGVFTEVIHTNAGLLGYPSPLADADFYPNGGVDMPGCLSQECDSNRSFHYFGESIRSGGFTGTRCFTFAAAMAGQCFMSGPLKMGGIEPKTGQSGIFHLRTNAFPPFSRG